MSYSSTPDVSFDAPFAADAGVDATPIVDASSDTTTIDVAIDAALPPVIVRMGRNDADKAFLAGFVLSSGATFNVTVH